MKLDVMERSYIKKRDNFLRTYRNLKDAFSEHYPPNSNFEVTGLIAYFQLCFEQAWKLLREYLISEGIFKQELNSPRSVLKRSYSSGLILKEEDWLDALKWRNDSTHQYSEQIAQELVKIIRERFIPMFSEIEKLLDS